MRTVPALLAVLVPALALALTACGDDGGNSPAPAIIASGGVHDPGIDGTVNVFVIDADTDLPLTGATVRIGDVEGATDATGLFVITGVTGPQTILAKASGHAAAMWVGADGANVTIPLDASPTVIAPPPQAELAGSITGWDALPAPLANHVRFALVTFAQDAVLGSKANDVMQLPPVNDLPAAACVRLPTAGSPPCAWRLNSRTGTVALGLIVIDLDTRGTPSQADDIQTVTGFSVKQPLTVIGGVAQTGLMMDLPGNVSTASATIDLGTPPAGLSQVNAVVGLELGAAGVLRLSTIDGADPTAIIPSLTVASAATYELIGLAQEPIADGTAAQSILLRRGITAATALAAGAWLPPPTALVSDRVTASFIRGRAAGPYIVELDSASGRALAIAILDASSRVTLPTAFAPLPAGALTMKVTTLETGALIDLRDFAVDDLTTGAVRFASDTIKLN